MSPLHAKADGLIAADGGEAKKGNVKHFEELIVHCSLIHVVGILLDGNKIY